MNPTDLPPVATGGVTDTGCQVGRTTHRHENTEQFVQSSREESPRPDRLSLVLPNRIPTNTLFLRYD